jgi:hypothetical protein
VVAPAAKKFRLQCGLSELLWVPGDDREFAGSPPHPTPSCTDCVHFFYSEQIRRTI